MFQLSLRFDHELCYLNWVCDHDVASIVAITPPQIESDPDQCVVSISVELELKQTSGKPLRGTTKPPGVEATSPAEKKGWTVAKPTG